MYAALIRCYSLHTLWYRNRMAFAFALWVRIKKLPWLSSLSRVFFSLLMGQFSYCKAPLVCIICISLIPDQSKQTQHPHNMPQAFSFCAVFVFVFVFLFWELVKQNKWQPVLLPDCGLPPLIHKVIYVASFSGDELCSRWYIYIYIYIPVNSSHLQWDLVLRGS